MPGPTDTEFFERADMMDTKVGQDDKKADPADVAKVGFQAMRDGEGDVAAGWTNKPQVAMANVTPAPLLAEQHRKMAEHNVKASKGSRLGHFHSSTLSISRRQHHATSPHFSPQCLVARFA